MKRQMTITLYTPGYTGAFYPDTAHSCVIDREDHCNGYPVYQGILVCTRCLNQWAKLSWAESDLEGAAGTETYEVRGLLCVECFRQTGGRSLHPDISPVAGSLLHNPTVNNWDAELLLALPEALVAREFELTMNSVLKEP